MIAGEIGNVYCVGEDVVRAEKSACPVGTTPGAGRIFVS